MSYVGGVSQDSVIHHSGLFPLCSPGRRRFAPIPLH